MNFLETVEKAKEIVEAIDAKDEATIAVLEKIASVSFVPEYFKVAVAVIKKFEPSIIVAILSAIALAEKLANSTLEKTSVKMPSVEKLKVAEVAVSNVNNASELLSKAVGIVNSILKLKR